MTPLIVLVELLATRRRLNRHQVLLGFASNVIIFVFSLSSSLQQIWTEWQKFLVEFSKFVKLGKCGPREDSVDCYSESL